MKDHKLGKQQVRQPCCVCQAFSQWQGCKDINIFFTCDFQFPKLKVCLNSEQTNTEKWPGEPSHTCDVSSGLDYEKCCLE